MIFHLNSKFRLTRNGENVFLVDITEKNYGRGQSVLMLNREGGQLIELLQNADIDSAINIIYEGEENRAEIKANVLSAVRALCEAGVLKGVVPKEATFTLPIEKVGFGPIKARYGMVRRPLIGVVELTSCCNLNCPHCYVKGLDSSRAISTDRILEIGRILHEQGILNVTLTGGEPMVHPDFPIIYRFYKEMGFLVDVFTNATRINESIADLFAELPPRSVDVTLYGLTNEEYNDFTGDSCGFSALQHGLNLLKARDVFFTTKMMCNKMNVHRVDDFCKFAYDYGAPFRYNLVIGMGNNTMKSPDELMLTNDEVLDLERRDPLRRTMFRYLAETCSNLPPDCEGCKEWSQYPCAAGIDKVFIGYDGLMSPCMTLRSKGLDIFKYGFDYIWHHWGEERKRRLTSEFKCVDCEYLPICTPCTEEFTQINGNPESVIEQRCELAKMRWNEFVKPFLGKGENK